MRGKLRDKRADSRQDHVKRELMERRRPPKRRATILYLQQLQEEDYTPDDEEAQLIGAQEQHT